MPVAHATGYGHAAAPRLRHASHAAVALALLIGLAVIAYCGTLHAQAPELQYLFPASATVGRETEVQLVGKQAETVKRIYFSRPGIEARLLDKGRAAITVAADALPGECDVWAASDAGLSAPVRLTVETAPIHTEIEPNNTADKAQALALPGVVYGKIEPGTDGDWYKVTLKADDTLTIAARSTTLGGTVWPTVTVLDPEGREVAHDSLTRLEPVVHLVATQAGDFSIGVQDRSYRTTATPFYQLSLTNVNWVTNLGTSSVTADKPKLILGQSWDKSAQDSKPVFVVATLPKVESADGGWRLTRSLFVNSFLFRPHDADNSVRIELFDRPLQSLDDLYHEAISKQPVLVLPSDLLNRFSDSREAVHWYRFTAKAGQTYWLEAVSERIDRPCDLELIVHDAAGKALATIGNIATPPGSPAGVPLDSRDPAGSWKAPADGEYLLAVRDLLATPDPDADRSYRLTVGARLEDVRVAALVGEPTAPRGWSVAPGGKLTIALAAFRIGGHEGPITVTAENLPTGLKAAPLTIAAKQNTGNLVIEAAKDAAAWLGPIRLTAKTEANRKPLAIDVQPVVGLPGTTPPQARICDEPVLGVLGK